MNEADDSGRHNDDNVTNVTLDRNPAFRLTVDDPNQAGHRLAANLWYRIFDRAEAGATGSQQLQQEQLVFDSFSFLGNALTDSNLLEQALSQVLNDPANGLRLQDGLHNLQLAVEDRAGNISHVFQLDVLIDTQAYPGGGDLHPDSDSGVAGFTGTRADRVTNDAVPGFAGLAEADSLVSVAIDGVPAGTAVAVPAGTAAAVPADGDDALQPPLAPYDGIAGNWRIDTPLNLADGEHTAVFTFEDPAGNRVASAPLLFFVDTRGPQVVGVAVNSVDASYNLFSPKPETAGPTPLVNALVISLQDLPARTANFLYDAVFVATATNPGHYLVRGDATGIVPISSVTFTPDGDLATPAADPLLPGAAATGYITLTFAKPLPDDRYTREHLGRHHGPGRQCLGRREPCRRAASGSAAAQRRWATWRPAGRPLHRSTAGRSWPSRTRAVYGSTPTAT